MPQINQHLCTATNPGHRCDENRGGKSGQRRATYPAVVAGLPVKKERDSATENNCPAQAG